MKLQIYWNVAGLLCVCFDRRSRMWSCHFAVKPKYSLWWLDRDYVPAGWAIGFGPLFLIAVVDFN